MGPGFRFDPPSFEIDDAAAWVLTTAFCRSGGLRLHVPNVDGELAAGLAQRLGLDARLGGTVPHEELVAALGEDAAGQLRSAYRLTVATLLKLEVVARQLAADAGALGLPAIFLKGMAMHFLGHTRIGTRQLSDIDVLVPANRVRELGDALLERGYRMEEVPSSQHQLAPLYHPLGAMIEIHFVVPGVRLEGRGASAGASELMAAGLCRPAEEVGGEAYVPGEDLLMAHLLAHTIAQHGTHPEGYPLARALSDVVDLGWDRERWDEFMAGPYAWIAADVGREEVSAVAGLAERLAGGLSPQEIARGQDGAGRLLRHVVLAVEDEEYRRSLRLGHLARALPAGGRLSKWASVALHTVFLNDLQVDLIYGRPRSRWGYLGWRLWRPFDLVIRASRYAMAWLALRRRKRG